MTFYKLTKQDGTTYRDYLYGEEGKVHSKPEKPDPKLCTSDVFHAYKNKNLAFLLNPIHANISNPRLWEIDGDVVCEDFGKVGSLSQKILRELDLPAWVESEKRNMVRVQFAILSAEKVLGIYETEYPGDSRPRQAVEAAKNYLQNSTTAARAAAVAAAAAAADAAQDQIDFCALADEAVRMVM